MSVQKYTDLVAWQKAMTLVEEVYRIARKLPAEERFGLAAQLRKSAVSIPANIAEGCGRGTDSELRQFLQIEMGSASELEYHLLLARDLGYLETATYDPLNDQVTEIKRMLAAFIHKLKADR